MLQLSQLCAVFDRLEGKQLFQYDLVVCDCGSTKDNLILGVVAQRIVHFLNLQVMSDHSQWYASKLDSHQSQVLASPKVMPPTTNTTMMFELPNNRFPFVLRWFPAPPTSNPNLLKPLLRRSSPARVSCSDASTTYRAPLPTNQSMQLLKFITSKKAHQHATYMLNFGNRCP